MFCFSLYKAKHPVFLHMKIFNAAIFVFIKRFLKRDLEYLSCCTFTFSNYNYVFLLLYSLVNTTHLSTFIIYIMYMYFYVLVLCNSSVLSTSLSRLFKLSSRIHLELCIVLFYLLL